jgi:hypothetical protein
VFVGTRGSGGLWFQRGPRLGCPVPSGRGRLWRSGPPRPGTDRPAGHGKADHGKADHGPGMLQVGERSSWIAICLRLKGGQAPTSSAYIGRVVAGIFPL